MLRVATKEYFEGLEEFGKHLPVGRDDELLVLKGHLLIERMLERFLYQNLESPEYLESARLSFAQKLAIVSALRSDPDAKWLWDACSSLNRLRNDLAHSLGTEKRADLQQQFLLRVEASPELPELEPPADVHDRLHRALFALHEAMSHRVNL